jgi:hypothetical protein
MLLIELTLNPGSQPQQVLISEGLHVGVVSIRFMTSVDTWRECTVAMLVFV